jgi:hypothetical protein
MLATAVAGALLGIIVPASAATRVSVSRSRVVARTSLNALGELARLGLQVFIRPTLSGSDYGLINDATLAPNPDYWAALLWHRVMRTRILRPHLSGAPALAPLRIHARTLTLSPAS